MALTQISTAGIKTDAVTADKLPVNSVGSSELADNAVDTAAIGDDSVTNAKLASNCITNSEIAGNSIDGDKISNTSITGVKLVNGAINEARLANGSVTTDKIAGDAVTGAKIADDAVGAEHIEDLDAHVKWLDSKKAVFGTGDDFQLYHNGTNNYLDTTNGHLYLRVNSTENAIKCTQNGNVEISYDGSNKFETISTGVKVQSSAAHCHLKINSANSNSSVIHFGTAADDDMAQIWYDDYSDALYYRTSTNTPQIFYTNNAERMRIASDGKIGIGLTNPVNNLDVSGSVSATGNMLNTAYANGVYIGTSGGLPAITAGKASTSAYAPLVFRQDHQAAGGERMRIAANGEVGINVTDPEAYGASGTGYAGLTVQAPSGGWSGITIRSSYAGGGQLAFADGSGSNAERKNLALAADHVNKRLNFLVEGATVCRLTEHGFHPNPADSAAANALNDYEEGSWTPALTRWTGSAWSTIGYDTSPSTNIGLYRKIGNVVYVTFDIAGFDVNSDADAAYVGMNGFPFTATSSNGNAGHIVVTYSADVFGNNTATSFWVSNGTTTSTTVRFGDDNGSHNTYAGGSSKRIRGNGFYFTS